MVHLRVNHPCQPAGICALRILIIAIAPAAIFFSGCQTLPHADSEDASRPFPYAAWLAAEQRLLDSPTPFHIQTAPEPVLIRGRNPTKTVVPSEEACLAGKIITPANPYGPRRIIVDLAGQKAYVLRGDWIEAITRVSTGRRAYPTPPGSYTISQKKIEHRSNLYGNYVDAAGKVVQADVDVRSDPIPEGATFAGSPMPFFQRLRDPANLIHGVGFHAGTLPGYPASHGCIRLPYEMARWLFQATSIGTRVLVIPAYPLPRPAEAGQSTRKMEFTAGVPKPAKRQKSAAYRPIRRSHSQNGETEYF